MQTQTDRQQTDRPTDKQTPGHTNILTDGQTETDAEKQVTILTRIAGGKGVPASSSSSAYIFFVLKLRILPMPSFAPLGSLERYSRTTLGEVAGGGKREDFRTKIAPQRLHANSRSHRPTRAPLMRAPLLRSHLL